MITQILKILLLCVGWFIVLLAGWYGRGIYEDQKHSETKASVTVGDAHKFGWLQGYSAAVENEKRGTPGSIRAMTLESEFLRDSLVAVNEFRAPDEKN